MTKVGARSGAPKKTSASERKRAKKVTPTTVGPTPVEHAAAAYKNQVKRYCIKHC
jgi:hypothetical protein